MDGGYRIMVTQAQRDRVAQDETVQDKLEVKQTLLGIPPDAGDLAGEQKGTLKLHSNTLPQEHSGSPQVKLSEDYVVGEAIPSKAKNLSQLLTTTTVENLLAECGKIQNLKESDSVETALQLLRDTGLQSVAVNDDSGKFLRLISTSDIFALFCLVQQDDLGALFKQSIKDIGSSSASTPMMPIGTTLAEAVKTLVTGSHYIGILDDFSKALFTVLSQLSVVQFIAKNISLMSLELRNLPVKEFMKQIVDVNTIPSDTETRKAFEYLFNDNISAAAVVDIKTGRIKDTISTYDLVGVLNDRFEHLSSSVTEFLNTTRRTKSLKPPITCTMEDTLENVITKLASTDVHRLWVVDSVAELQYLGFVNLTNVLEAINATLE